MRAQLQVKINIYAPYKVMTVHKHLSKITYKLTDIVKMVAKFK